MADHPDGQDGVDEPALPFGTSVVDDSDEVVDLTANAGEPADSELLTVTDDEGESATPDAGLQPDSTDVQEQASAGLSPESSDEAAGSDSNSESDWEVLDIESDPAVELAAVDATIDESVGDSREAASEGDSDTLELEALAEGPSALDDFSHGDYVAATTVEYQGLAEAIEAADLEQTQMSAVAVTMPGLESGVVGFEDVTGEQETLDETDEAPQSGSDLGLRVVTALILMGMLVAALWAGGGWFVAFVTILGILALGEFYGTVRTAGYQPIALIGFLTLIAMMIAGFRYGPFGIVGWYTVGLVAVLVWYAVVVRRNPLANASLTILGFAWIGVLLAFVATLAATAAFRQLTLAIVLVVAALDVGSYFAGRSFGRTKMSPILSPKKTYEGLLGGVVLAVAMAVGISFIDWFAPLDLRGGLFLAGVAVALGPFGDLAVSMLKRQIGVKDMGSILPGHGGILDRIDALLFIVPVAYFVFSWLGYFAS